MRTIIHIIFLLLIVPVLQGQVRFVPASESSLWIEGSSTTVNFTCNAGELKGWGLIHNQDIEKSSPSSNPSAEPEIQVNIPVDQFDCGRGRMNRDFKEALKADQHADISFTFLHAEELSPKNGEDARFAVTGRLTVAGTSREVKMEVEGHQLSLYEFRVKGSKEIKMTEFDVTPPSALMGLIQTKDELTVHFDITVKPEQMQ